MLVATVVIMSRMNGATIVTHLRATHPNTQVPIYLWAAKRNFIDMLPEENSLLPNPLQSDELISRLQALLNDADDCSAA